MTLYDLIYIIGCGVAFIMAIFGFSNSVQVKEEIGDKPLVLFASSLMVSLLSWGVPIWWLGFHYLIEKKGRWKMKELAEYMMRQKQKVKCEKCGKEFDYSVIDDVYVYLPTGNCRICCPHCETEYDYCIKLTKVEELKDD